ncbi:hypothetical protein [Prescottella agglutinans]|uniref:Uncharacterized protein n=1 Tax=Prescottella agglutinans TaxID=1644129 RepID=A0ABT6MK97_9NOCA|nr:hypothetical protein [Prescottella agglutinans]MDH6284742.1 hypothetical protein [Prescottella agglutinans]
MAALNEPIPYDRMRRLLGLPDLMAGSPVRWAVRKIRTGAWSGQWGVWRCPDSTNYVLVEAFRTWPDAIDGARRAVDDAGRGTSATDLRAGGEGGRAADEVLAQA